MVREAKPKAAPMARRWKRLRSTAAVIATQLLLLAALLTPLSMVVLGLYDVKSAVIVAITLPLIPTFMVLIGLATADRSAAALAAMMHCS